MDDWQKQNDSGKTHDKYTEAYIDILNTYKQQITDSVNQKNGLKIAYFFMIAAIMSAIMVLFFKSVIISLDILRTMASPSDTSLENPSIPVVVGAITTTLSTCSTVAISLFKLPKIIANYLFNSDEDKYMVEVITNIQKYEIEAVKLEWFKIASTNVQREIRERSLQGTAAIVDAEFQAFAGAEPQEILDERTGDD